MRDYRATLAIVRARKLVAILLSLGYLAAVHCRTACAFSIPLSAAVEKQESDCHHEEGEPKGHDSKPCCMTVGGDEALLPTDAPTLAPQVVLSFVMIAPHVGPAVMPSRLLGAKQNHDPPRVVSEVLPLSSLSPRAPPTLA